jgi:heme exporter protein B
MTQAGRSLAPPGMTSASPSGALARVWAICAKDAAQEARRRIALASILFFAATALTLVSFAVGPAGFAPEERAQLHAALLWVLLFFSTATGLPRSFVREEETGTALALRKLAPGILVLAGKALFNYFLFLAIAAVTIPGLGILLGWDVASPAALAVVVAAAGYGVTVVSTFLSALVARAGQKNVLFVLVCFPLLVPLLLSSIVATVAAAGGELAGPPLRVILAYDGAATCAAYLLAAAAWEE